jgi:hypothetical protein
MVLQGPFCPAKASRAIFTWFVAREAGFWWQQLMG